MNSVAVEREELDEKCRKLQVRSEDLIFLYVFNGKTQIIAESLCCGTQEAKGVTTGPLYLGRNHTTRAERNI